MFRRFSMIIFCLLSVVMLSGLTSADSTQVLNQGDRVAIAGDSITEQRIYSRYMEDYLVACVPQLELEIMQFGWGGETAAGFVRRMDNDLLPYNPNVVTICYGMNDGRYVGYTEEIGRDYAEAMQKIIASLKGAGAEVVAGSPGVFDTDFFPPNWAEISPQVYNETLAHLRDHARTIAAEAGAKFANVHDEMMKAMLAAKKERGSAYHVAGVDGIHPWDNGHLAMAYVFLKALGLDGNIGIVRLDMNGAASATEGHRVISWQSGDLLLESLRYPFCFPSLESIRGEEEYSARSMLPYVSFNEELNRFLLVVENLDSERVKVTWGEASLWFNRDQLERGINLAAEFLDNPFSEAFRELDETVAQKQVFERVMVKNFLAGYRQFSSEDLEEAGLVEAFDRLRSSLNLRHDELVRQVRNKVVPIRHALKVEAE